jgi:2-polyprenyl-3-methyl-5-hydroxy-6-metoxy-1,4-benzoquinol methylase
MPSTHRGAVDASSFERSANDASALTRNAGETQKCPYCAGPAQRFISSTDRNRRTTTSVFHYHRCPDCGLIFMDPIPADLVPFYQDGYEAIPRSLSDLRELAASERHRLDPVLKYKNGGKLLEIGPWRGVFSCNAKDAGFDVTALERDQDCVAFLNETIGIRAVQTFDPAAALETLNEKFDVITMWHSLEHLRSPWLVVEQAARHLATGGILVLAIPNIQSYQFSILKSWWKHLDAPRHLFFFPFEFLEKICEKNGLALLESTTNNPLSAALSYDTWYSLASSILPIRYARGALARLMQLAARARESQPNAGAGLTLVFELRQR